MKQTTSKLVIVFCLSIFMFSCKNTGKQESIAKDTPKKPNILWIFAEDLSPLMGCYGDSINKGHTPVIDKLASDGVLFTRAYATAPVCSASRSAIMTGVMQTTLGLHNHRSSRTTDGEVVPDSLRLYLPEDMKTLPELMRDAGYFTFNSGKDDYNFHYDRGALYSVGNAKGYKPGMNGWQGNKAEHYMSVTEDTWNARKDKDQPWFGQIEIKGGKGGAKHIRKGEKLDEFAVPVPPYFPDVTTQRKAWVGHYNANRSTDVDVETILKQLEADGELDNTIVFFFSDHGNNESIRHKQFCYEGGMLVPLMIKGNHPTIKPGTVRDDLVSLLDVTATTLGLGGVEVPDYFDGQDLFNTAYKAPEYVMGARDRCDFTIDRIRTVVSEEYRYIRNYHPDRPLLQAGYRDNKPIVIGFKEARAEGKLNAYQEEHWFGIRPKEELYHLANDPHQINNLADNPEYATVLKTHINVLEDWVKKTDDKGQYPEAPVQLRATYNLWKVKKQFIDAVEAGKANPEYHQFMK